MKYLFLPAITLLLAACHDAKEADTNAVNRLPDQKEQPAVSSNEECFRWVKNNDTIAMRIVRTADNVHGELHYNWYEKDKSRGKIHGVFKRDTLRADWRFHSEGMESFREIVFVRKGNQLVQGNGDMVEKNGKMVFTGPLDFNETFALTKVNCE